MAVGPQLMSPMGSDAPDRPSSPGGHCCHTSKSVTSRLLSAWWAEPPTGQPGGRSLPPRSLSQDGCAPDPAEFPLPGAGLSTPSTLSPGHPLCKARESHQCFQMWHQVAPGALILSTSSSITHLSPHDHPPMHPPSNSSSQRGLWIQGPPNGTQGSSFGEGSG